MIIRPKVRGFVCVTAHPFGCAAHVKRQIAAAEAAGPIKDGPKSVLVVGSSTGYGLASRIAATFGCGADSLGIFFERPPENGRLATAGWYNSAAFSEAARQAGRKALNLNGDAFSDEIKARAVELIKAELGKIDLIVYSLASPRRNHPKTGQTHRSVLKCIGQSYTTKSLDTDKNLVTEVTIGDATPTEIEDTIAVMGGEDWEWWIDALEEGGVLADGATTVAYSYIGPEVTWPVYRHGTIGRAKEDLEAAARRLDARLKSTYGRAFVSINKALVTQASSAIPVVPLYISLLYKVMKAKGLHEGCIEQMVRLFKTQMYGGSALDFDDGGRVRLDDLEMRPDVQAEVADLWLRANNDTLRELADLDGYHADFLTLFGFGLDGIDYEADVDVESALVDL
ncbi:MAG: trans-2-enoyl-CoA reductase family protein [Puniceicoccaceae bacterium]|nr:MAG: trans-2-enoyl-CoA reductase family protein [Puniceicoccaceae bacterium]